MSVASEGAAWTIVTEPEQTRGVQASEKYPGDASPPVMGRRSMVLKLVVTQLLRRTWFDSTTAHSRSRNSVGLECQLVKLEAAGSNPVGTACILP